MDFRLNEDQQMMQDMVRKFAKEEIEPKAAEIDESREFPKETIREMGKLGLMGIVIPEKYGGAGFDFLSLAIAVEEISRACASTGVIVAVNNSLAAFPIYEWGTEFIREKYVKPLALVSDSATGNAPGNTRLLRLVCLATAFRCCRETASAPCPLCLPGCRAFSGGYSPPASPGCPVAPAAEAYPAPGANGCGPAGC